MGKKMDILTTLSKGIYTDDSYNVIDQQAVDMINEYYRRFKQDIKFQGRMNITILSLDNLDGKEGKDLRWQKIKEALPDVYDKDFVDFTLINCRNMQEIESSFVDHANYVYNTYEARTIVISRFEIFKDFLKSKEWINQAQFIVWHNTKDEWLKSRIKTANYEDNLKIEDSVVTIDFDSLKINLFDPQKVLQKILNYREVNHRGKLTFVVSDNYTVQEMYDILGLPYGHYGYIWIIGKDSGSITKENFQEYIKKFKSSFICMNEEFLKKCKTKDVSRTVYTITNNGITLVKKPKEMPRLSRPYFGVKSDKIEHKAALSQRWYFLLQENTWRDKNGNRHFVPNMSENYIKNCILWLDETLCGKYIPDPDLRRQFKSLFQNELSHRDTLNRLSSYDLADLFVNYKKNHENDDLLDKYSQILYSRPFWATAGSEKVHILKSIEIDEKLKKEKRVIKIHKKDEHTTLYLCVDDSIICRIEPHYEDGHLLGESQFLIPPKDDEAYKNLLKEFENEPYLTSNIISEKELLGGKKFQDLHSQMAIKCGIDVNDLPSMTTRRTEAQKYMVEKITNDLKAFGTEEVIKHYQNMRAIEKPYYYWKELETITSPINGSTKIPIKVRMMLNIIAHNNYKKIYEDKVGKESGRWSASEPQFLSKEEHNDFHGFDKKENDMVEHPNHYAQTRIECIDAIEACIEPYQDPVDAYLTSNALKYIWRHPFKKNPAEDLKKAIWYISRLVKKYENGEIKSQINKE